MSGAVLLTGGTGFLGMDALARLIERGDEDEPIAVLIRARDDVAAQQRLREVLARLYNEPPRPQSGCAPCAATCSSPDSACRRATATG